jgi:ribosomal protein S12 methylthiotransferase
LKTKTSNTKVNIVTLGCSKNLVDSENILTQLRGGGIDAVHESKKDDAGIIIVNTCGFIDNAKQESIDTILRYADAKAQGEINKLYVTGCLSQRYRDDLQGEIPEVDAFFGTMELPLLLNRFNVDYKHELLGERITTSSAHFAYMKISEGCDRPCSFCAIPIMRGKHRSVPMEDLVIQAENLVKNGVKEILLIAQDSTYYGLDIYKKRNLSDLLRKLAGVEGLDWIRIHYAYPSGFPQDILDVMAEHENICNYIDIPLQHSSDRMLKVMRRGITEKKTQELLASMRSKVPNISIRTTLISGHPGETEEDHQHLMDFVRAMKFDRLGVFTYSHEEDTFAGDTMQDELSEEVKEKRAAEIMEIQEEISKSLNLKKIGLTFKTLIDRKEGEYFVGRTYADSPEVDNEVLISAKDTYLKEGHFYNVEIEDAESFDLFGKVISPC